MWFIVVHICTTLTLPGAGTIQQVKCNWEEVQPFKHFITSEECVDTKRRRHYGPGVVATECRYRSDRK